VSVVLGKGSRGNLALMTMMLGYINREALVLAKHGLLSVYLIMVRALLFAKDKVGEPRRQCRVNLG
jgi:hypothetical protein